MNRPARVRKHWPRGTWMKPKTDVIHMLLADSRHSYADAARYLGCSKQMVGHLAKDPKKTCSPELAQKLAVLLGVRIDVIFDARVPTADSSFVTQQRRAA